VAGLLAVLSGIAGTVPAAAQPAPGGLLSGWLTIVWPDAQPSNLSPGPAGRPVVTLRTDEGEPIRLAVAPGVAALDFGRHHGGKVTVSVASVEPAIPGGLMTPERTARATVTGIRSAAPSSDAPAAATGTFASTPEGSQRWVTLACKFGDNSSEPRSLGYFAGMYSSAAPGLDHYWREVSFDRVNLSTSGAYGWFTLPRPRSAYVSGGIADLDLLAQDCTATAESSVSFATVNGINLMFNDDLDGYAWGGTAWLSLDGLSTTWRVTWMPPWAYSAISVVAHEMGHGFGLPHSSGDYGDTYDNPWDVMSRDRYRCSSGSAVDPVYGCKPQHTIGYHKNLLAWIPAARRLTLPHGSPRSTVTLESLAAMPASNYLVAILETGEAGGRHFTVEARTRIGYDSKVMGDGVVIHEIVPGRLDANPAHVVDADQDGDPADSGTLWTVGETFTDPSTGITVTVDAATATGFLVTMGSGDASPAPTVSAVSPAAGPTTGGTLFTVTGTGFAAGQSSVTVGGVGASSVDVTSSTTLTAVTPSRPAGPADVGVTTPGGSSSLPAAFTYYGPPVLSSVSPSSGPATGGSVLSISGSDFVAGATNVTVGGVAAAGVNVVSPTLLTAVSPGGTAGSAPVQVFTPAGPSLHTPLFTYVDVPAIAAVSPQSGPAEGGTVLTVTGTGFVVGATTVTVGGVPASSVNVTSAATLTALTPAHAPGAAAVAVTTSYGTATLPASFTYLTPAPPALGTVNPATGPSTGGTLITLTGSGFVPNQTAVSLGGAPASGVLVVSDTLLRATAPAHAEGPVTVAVTTPHGTATMSNAFTFTAPAAPVLASIHPVTGPSSGGTRVTLTGSGFVAGQTVVTVGGQPATGIDVRSDVQMLVTTPPGEGGADAAVVVTTPYGSAILPAAFRYSDAIAQPWRAYLAEGATGAFFDLDVAIANPHPEAVNATVTFLREDGGTVVETYALPPEARRTLRVDDVPGLAGSQVAVSTVVEAAAPLLVERTMFWSEREYYAGHGSAAVEGASTTWYFAEGCQGFFDTYLQLANANPAPANVTVTFLRESGTPVVSLVTVPPNARKTVFAGDYPALLEQGFSTVVSSDVPIIAERAMYFGTSPFWKAGHESAGVPIPSTRWFLAEGATGSYFDTYVLVANPNPHAVTVSFTFLLGGEHAGTTYAKAIEVAASSRLTVDLEGLALQEGFALLSNAAVSTVVDAASPIVVERAMYWPGGPATWAEAHNSFGVTGTGTRWGVSEGRKGGPRGFETYLLLANPSTTADAVVTLTFLRESGVPVVLTVPVARASRRNVFVNGDVAGLADGERFGTVIESLPVPGVPEGVPITVERAMYWGSGAERWAGGTNATAIRLP
jgi:M6 family metalloprotease-like protein